MPPVGFEPTIPASSRQQTYALDRTATEIGNVDFKGIYYLSVSLCFFCVSQTVFGNRRRPTKCIILGIRRWTYSKAQWSREGRRSAIALVPKFNSRQTCGQFHAPATLLWGMSPCTDGIGRRVIPRQARFLDQRKTFCLCSNPTEFPSFLVRRLFVVQTEISQLCTWKLKVNQSLCRPGEVWGFQEVEAPRFQDNQHMKVVRSSALHTGNLNPPPQKFSWYWFYFCGTRDSVGVVLMWARIS